MDISQLVPAKQEVPAIMPVKQQVPAGQQQHVPEERKIVPAIKPARIRIVLVRIQTLR